MTDESRPDDPTPPEEAEPPVDAAPAPPPEPVDEDIPAEVAIVTPASAYGSIDTIDEAAPTASDSAPEAPEPALPDRSSAVLGAIEHLETELGRRIDALRLAFERELRAESSREKVVDRLHAELQDYKSDLLLKVLRPVFVDLIQLHDDMGKMAESLGDERAAALLRDFQVGVEDILYRQGVEPYSAEGDAFDPRRQRAVSTAATDDPALVKTIAARLRPGFASGETIIRPELVSVHAQKKA